MYELDPTQIIQWYQ